MKKLSKKLEELMIQEKKNNQKLNEQLQFLQQAQQAGVISKPQYSLASLVNVRTSI
ncbi:MULTISPECIES: hypothetical protein [Shewanella]|uniref:Uncharacterized protein n=1 Tax=Shewanella scandinavica TaxID=3063538 RepID=A0ABU3G3I5_9GAMM|nr:hypothetical protein [Shewanella sp. SP2S1-2]MDT3282203.1 hypothetical protein [Shewanella sp. SP2S1-2]